VAPAELEGILLSHPAIASAAVIPIADERYGELPRAYVVLKEAYHGQISETEIKQFVARQVAEYKQLAGGVVFTKVIPVAASGKILRRQLRELAKKELENG
jgi:4-coumarate--CoA ligase